MNKETFLQEIKQFKLPTMTKDFWLENGGYETKTFHYVPLCSFGDYDNSCDVERVNQRVVLEVFKRAKWTGVWSGSYGSELWGFVAEELPQSSRYFDLFVELLEQLADYPLLEDFDGVWYDGFQQDVMAELWQEAFDGWLDYDLGQELEKADENLSLADFGDDICDLLSVYCETSSGGGWWIESGGNVVINDQEERLAEFVQLMIAYQKEPQLLNDWVWSIHQGDSPTKKNVILYGEPMGLVGDYYQLRNNLHLGIFDNNVRCLDWLAGKLGHEDDDLALAVMIYDQYQKFDRCLQGDGYIVVPVDLTMGAEE